MSSWSGDAMRAHRAALIRSAIPLGFVLATCTGCQPGVDVYVRNDCGRAVQVDADEGGSVSEGPGYARVADGARRHIVLISALAKVVTVRARAGPGAGAIQFDVPYPAKHENGDQITIKLAGDRCPPAG
jgi:hypothetical protein